jgi:hypothetical protein
MTESVSHFFVRKLLLKYVYSLQCKCLQIISEDRTRNIPVDSSYKGNILRSFVIVSMKEYRKSEGQAVP